MLNRVSANPYGIQQSQHVLIISVAFSHPLKVQRFGKPL